MSNVAEIASFAQYISAQELANSAQQVQISVLKEGMEVEELLQQQLGNMIQELMPHLGNAVNISI